VKVIELKVFHIRFRKKTKKKNLLVGREGLEEGRKEKRKKGCS